MPCFHSLPRDNDDSKSKTVIDLFMRMCKRVYKSSCRKTVPSTACPNEVWRLILCFNSRNAPRGTGLGYNFMLWYMHHVRTILVQVMWIIVRIQATPMQWHHSNAISLQKKSASDVEHIFDDCGIAQVRMVYDKIDNKFKGYCYSAFKKMFELGKKNEK